MSSRRRSAMRRAERNGLRVRRATQTEIVDLLPALSPAGRAAVSGDAFGAIHSKARLQTDLTDVVLGEPGPELIAALDTMADREQRSAATTWRFSAARVRRAMDAGASCDGLLAALREIAEGLVPQPPEYLFKDVARRHGTVRGGTIACYLRSDDLALLSELVVDRKLRKLGLRRIAPTVVVGASPFRTRWRHCEPPGTPRSRRTSPAPRW